MPDSATLNIAVEDNDPYLSGDSRRNENATDRYGQEASITVDGEEIGNGGQIYAEKYMWLCDNFGNYYVMVEIEQEGTNEDFFTFYEPFGIPAPGTVLTVVGGGNITTCGWNPKYDDLGGGDVSAPGALNGTYFFDTDGSDTNNGEAGVIGAQVTLTNVDTGETFTTVTDDDGFYSFFGLDQGNYTVSFAEIDGYGFVTAGQGGDTTIDSDVDQNGVSYDISIGSGEVVANVDAGIRPCGDIDGNAGQDDDLVGCDTDDHIRGFSGDDVIDGRGGDDVIDVGRGDDTAIGGSGDDTIDGGEGFDVAVFAGNSADYTITVTSQDGSTVTVVGPDGEDTLIDVELLRFDDEDILVSSFILSASDDIADLPALNGTVTVDVLANDNAGLALRQSNRSKLGQV
jgi:Ca2+-binding RTX toxin-like protein